MRWQWVAADAVLWVLATAYIFYGVDQLTFHGDESIYIAQGEAIYFVLVERDIRDLVDLYEPGTQRFRREISYFHVTNPPIGNYLIGLAWMAADYAPEDLPGKYDFSQSLITNVELGNVPTFDLLVASRMASAALLSLSVLCVYGVGRMLGGRKVGYLAAALYATNPAVLSDGRRAMHEVPMMFFGTLAVLVGLWMLQRQSDTGRIPVWQWLLLGLVSALMMASKFTGAAYLVGIFGALFLVAVFGRRWRRVLGTVAWLCGCCVIIVMFYYAVSPPLWQNIGYKTAFLLDNRQTVAVGHSEAFGDGGDMVQRVERATTWQYLNPPYAYKSAWHSGLVYWDAVGILLIALTGLGVVVGAWQTWRNWSDNGTVYLGALLPLAAWFLVLMLTPIGWGRYYTPSMTMIAVFTSVGAWWMLDAAWRLARRNFPLLFGASRN